VKTQAITSTLFPLNAKRFGVLLIMVGFFFAPFNIFGLTNFAKVIPLAVFADIINFVAPNLVIPFSTMAFWLIQATGLFLMHNGIELFFGHTAKFLTPFYVKVFVLIPFYIIVTYAILATGFMTLPIDIPA